MLEADIYILYYIYLLATPGPIQRRKVDQPYQSILSSYQPYQWILDATLVVSPAFAALRVLSRILLRMRLRSSDRVWLARIRANHWRRTKIKYLT